MLVLSLFFVRATASLAQAADDSRERLAIRILEPAENAHVYLDEPSVDLKMRITARAGLQHVVAEARGPFTGVFFTICGEEAAPCQDKTPRHDLGLSLPVFQGENQILVHATDLVGNTATATRTIQVSLAEFRGDSGGDARDRYDLLILTHKKPDGEDFVAALQPLVKHKNATGMPTKLLTLEEIYETPPFRGYEHPEIIKKAIADARLRWGIRYVMLVGDSDRFPVRYIRLYDLGHWGHGFAPSDLYYADLFKTNGGFDSWDMDGDGLYGEGQGNFPTDMNDLNQDQVDLLPDVAVGRVPVSSVAELETYVKKVILYETTADPSWTKKALLVSGNYQWSNATSDKIGNHLSGAGYTLQKLYHDAVWPGTTEQQRWPMIEAALDAGVGIVSYVGHGAGVGVGQSDGGLWGGWYRHFRIPTLANEGKLPIIFSAACETAMFHYGKGPYFAKWGYVHQTEVSPPKYRWAPEPISYSPEAYDVDAFAEHFLVKGEEGAVAFIGSYTGTQGDSHTLAKFFFKAHANGVNILGDAWNAALTEFINGPSAGLGFPGTSWYTYASWSHVNKMLLFGDPSLRIGGRLPDLRPVAPAATGFCTVRDGKLWVRVANAGPGSAGPSTTQVDFGRYGQVSLATSPLANGDHQDFLVEIPDGCFDSDCDFDIEVDTGGSVSEADETNNRATGKCIG